MRRPNHFLSRQPGSFPIALFKTVLFLTLAALPSAHGASRFWDGSVNGNFGAAGNWVGNVAPTNGDDIVFQTGIAQLLVTNDFSPNRPFNSILFQGSNYFVRGNALLVTNGISSINPVGANHVDADVQVRASQAWEAQGALASIDVNGDINLNANTLTVRAATGDFFFSGIISGTGSLVKTNVGTLRLDGSGHNTFTGLTRFDGGVLELNKFAIIPVFTNFTAIPGDLTVGDGNGLVGTDVLRLLTDDQIANISDVTVKNSGLFNLNNQSDQIASLTMQGGEIDTGTGLLTLGGNVTGLGDANVATIDGNLSLGGLTRTFDIGSGGASPDMVIRATISPGTTTLFATAGIVKNGPGSLQFTGTNTYNGVTTINDGQLAISADRALGATVTVLGAPVGTVINGDANLFLSNVQVTNEALTINAVNTGGDFNASGASIWTGDILLNSETFISSSGSLLLNGAITGVGGFTKISGGSVTLAGTNANTYTGTTTVRDGTLLLGKDAMEVIDGAMSGPLVIGDGSGTDIVRLANDNQIADTTEVHINLGGRFDVNDMLETTGAIDGRGLIDLGSGQLRAGADNDSSTFSGLIIGTGTLFKLGTGTWTLTGDNTYSGQTTVSAGTLVVDGSQPQSPVVVNGTANLAGNGVIGNLQVFGSVRPGTSPGVLTTSNINFAAQGDYFVELNGSTVGTGYDQLNVRGTNQLGGSTLHVTVGAGFAPVEGERLTIINNDGSEAIQGTFAGLPNGTVFTAGGLQFRILYADIFLNDVILVVTNTALKLAAAPVIETGNGNGEIEPGECNLLRIPLMNKLAGIVSGVSATLSSTNPDVTITQSSSTYPNLPASGMSTNDVPFQISTSPSLICGTNIDLVLTVHTATNGSFSVPIRIFTGTAGNPQRFNRTGDQAIPDGGVLDSTITVSGVTTPTHHVVISLHLSHTVDDNLDISIEDPDGTTVSLSSDNGGTLDDYGTSCADADRTTFSDAALLPITSGTTPFRGTFRPEQSLSVYRGKFGSDVNGTWHLNIADDTAGGLGTLHCWSIIIFPTVCTPGGGECDPPCPGCPVHLDIAGDPSSTNRVLLKWTTSAVGYNLVATNSLQNPPNAFAPIGPAPVVVGSKFTVTNTTTGSARFYELRKP